jgi:AraC-like DNA-binding protein
MRRSEQRWSSEKGGRNDIRSIHEELALSRVRGRALCHTNAGPHSIANSAAGSPGFSQLSTDDIAEKERFDYWRDVISREYANLEVRATGALERFSGRAAHMNVGSAAIREVTAGPTPHIGLRTPQAIARAEEQYFVVTVVVDGNGAIVQGERVAVLGPGDLTLHDLSRPVTIQFERGFHMYVLHFPHTLMQAVFPQAFAATVLTVSGRDTAAGLVRPLCDQLFRSAGTASPGAQQHLATAAMELVSGSLADLTSQTIGAPMRTAHLVRARQHIEQHLWDPELSVEAIAGAVFISSRYLRAIFQDSGTTVSRYLMERRLDRALHDLADPGVAHVSVADIAARLGFKSAGHFATTFKAKFGMSPREHRRAQANAAGSARSARGTSALLE